MERIKNFLIYKLLVEVKIFFQMNYCLAKNAIKTINAHYYEKRLGIETSVPYLDEGARSKDGDRCIYNPTGYTLLKKMVVYLNLEPNDVFVDLGCGKGRVIFYAAQQKIKTAIGVEANKVLADIAKINLSNLKINHSPIEIFNSDVIDFDCKTGTVFFIYAPFGYKTFTAVFENIRKSLLSNPRKIRIVYANPVYKGFFNDQDWLVFEHQIENAGMLVWRSIEN